MCARRRTRPCRRRACSDCRTAPQTPRSGRTTRTPARSRTRPCRRRPRSNTTTRRRSGSRPRPPTLPPSPRPGSASPPPPARRPPARLLRERDRAFPGRRPRTVARARRQTRHAPELWSCRRARGQGSRPERRASRDQAPARADPADGALAEAIRSPPPRRRGSRGNRPPATLPCARRRLHPRASCRGGTRLPAPRIPRPRRRATTPPSSTPRRTRVSPALREPPRRTSAPRPTALPQARSSRFRDQRRFASASSSPSTHSRWLDPVPNAGTARDRLPAPLPRARRRGRARFRIAGTAAGIAGAVDDRANLAGQRPRWTPVDASWTPALEDPAGRANESIGLSPGRLDARGRTRNVDFLHDPHPRRRWRARPLADRLERSPGIAPDSRCPTVLMRRRA